MDEPDLSRVERIACIGEVMIELSSCGEDTMRVGVAGDSFNTAVYLKRLLGSACEVDFITALGRDAFSDRILGEMRGHGLGVSAIEFRADRLPGLYAIATDESGERSFSYWRSNSAARTLFVEPCEIGLDRIKAYDLLFLSGITLAVLAPETRAALAGAVRAFRDQGGIFAYDSNHRPRLWQDAATAREVNAQFWCLSDIALPSIDDEMAIFGDTDGPAVVARLAGFGATCGALKRGAEGPLDLSGRTGPMTFPPAARIVDTTAAGDSFNAGYLAALIVGGDRAAALQGGHQLASRVIGHRGAIIDT